MATTYIRSSSKYVNGGYARSFSVSFTTSPTAGNLIVVFIGGWYAAGTGSIESVTDNHSNSLTIAAQRHPNNPPMGAIAYLIVPSTYSGTYTVTINAPSGGSYYYTGIMSEFSGINGSTPFATYAVDPNAPNRYQVEVSGDVSDYDYTLVVGLSNNSTGAGNCNWVKPSDMTEIFAEGSSGGAYSATEACYKIVTATSDPLDEIWTFNQGGVYSVVGLLVAFQPSAGGDTTTTKTQSSIARIAGTTTKTQPSTARVRVTTLKTITAVARLAVTTLKTITSVARITAQTIKTQNAIARIQKSATKTQTSVARVTVSTTKTQPAVSRVTKSVLKTISSVANIVVTGSTSRTITSLARIAGTTLRTTASIARISIQTAKTQGAVSRISKQVTKTQPSVASILVTGVTTKTQPSTARIAGTTLRTLTAVSRIMQLVTKAQVSVGRIQLVRLKTQLAVARVTATTLKTQVSTGNVQKVNQKTITSVAKITLAGVFIDATGRIIRPMPQAHNIKVPAKTPVTIGAENRTITKVRP